MKNAILKKDLKGWSDAYKKDPARQVATLALGKADVTDASFSPGGFFKMQQKFSVEIPTLPVTDQERSGRCWIFAATNVLREEIAKKLNLADFQLSQSYLAVWDKFERCNYFLETILQTASLPTADRTVNFILKSGVHDGGQWEMFANIVRKYGVVPRDVYGETFQSSHTRGMNALMNRNLKVCAVKLRNMIADGADQKAVRGEKEAMLGKLYGFLASCYTQPPESFDFEYVDREKVYHRVEGMTPKRFAEEYLGELMDDFVSIINAPTRDKPFDKTYTIRYLGNVVGGREILHLNLSLEDFKAAIIRQLQAGRIVWFGSDVGKSGEREKGVWDDGTFDYETMTGLDLAISKGDGLDYRFSAMGHAMCLTGVNLEKGKPTRWKIENSWGDKSGAKGYYVCSDSWFDKYVYQASVSRAYLGDKAKLLEQKPVVLDAWDPMGTLAN
ncbi:MAG: C1 family peptidase [Clostridia bacterium]|nr:C1 family peptidase [Clostridia bacterium]